MNLKTEARLPQRKKEEERSVKNTRERVRKREKISMNEKNI